MPPPVTVAEDADRIEALLERCPLGGLVLFNGPLPDTPQTLAHLQAKSPFPLLIAADIERGVGQQMKGGTVFPHALAFSALGEHAEDAVETSARVAAREALASGLHMTFGPVADVNRDQRNPIIATRAFGTEPHATSRLVQAYIRGCRAEGLLTSAKHFPGHGGTTQDSHEELPLLSDTRIVIEQTDLVPFRAAIDAEVDSLMTAHVAYPALDDSGLPATASKKILHDLLRDELGFQGVVITDSLLMGAIRAEPGQEGRQAATLIGQGVDIILDPPDPEAAVAGLVRAVEEGFLSEERLNDAVQRVWKLKQHFIDRFGDSFFTNPSTYIEAGEGEAVANQSAAEDIACRAVSIQDPQGALSIAQAQVAEEGLAVILVKPYRTRLDPPEEPLGAYVRDAYPGVLYREVGPEADDAFLHQLREETRRVKHLVIAVVVKPAAWQPFGLLPNQHVLVEDLVERQPVIMASLGVPHILDLFPNAVAHLCTFSDVPVSQRALVVTLEQGRV